MQSVTQLRDGCRPGYKNRYRTSSSLPGPGQQATGQDRANFYDEARRELSDWLTLKPDLVTRNQANPNSTQMAPHELTELYSIAHAAVQDMYGGFLTNAASGQTPLPQSRFDFVDSKHQGINGVCQRVFNLLASKGLYQKHNLVEPTRNLTMSTCNGLSPGCQSPAVAPPFADDFAAAKAVVCEFVCANQRRLLVNADWDPGFTDSTNRQVYIQGRYAADHFINRKNNQRSIDAGHAKTRWKALMTTVHEILHTLVHPRFIEQTRDPTHFAFPSVGVEGFTEYLASFVKAELEKRVKDPADSSFAQSVVGGASPAYTEAVQDLKADRALPATSRSRPTSGSRWSTGASFAALPGGSATNPGSSRRSVEHDAQGRQRDPRIDVSSPRARPCPSRFDGGRPR